MKFRKSVVPFSQHFVSANKLQGVRNFCPVKKQNKTAYCGGDQETSTGAEPVKQAVIWGGKSVVNLTHIDYDSAPIPV